MSDVSVLEAISLLTKVSADTNTMLKKLAARVDKIENKTTNKKKKLIREVDPVLITDFGPKAEKDLKRIFGERAEANIQIEREKNNNSNLLKLLGMAGAGALALKFLFEGKGFTGLIQGFQNIFKTITSFVDKTKSVISNIKGKLGNFADDVSKSVKDVVDNIITKSTSWYSAAKSGINNAMNNVSKRVGDFGDEIGRGLTKIIENTKNVATKISSKVTAAANVSGKVVETVADKPGLFSRIGSGISSATSRVGSTIVSAGEKVASVGGKVVSGAKAVGSKVVNFTKNEVLDRLKNAIGIVKPLKLAKGLLKSPFLAPIVEGFFTYKDVQKLLSNYKDGKITDKELNFKIGERLIESVSGLIGGGGGVILGKILGAGAGTAALPGLGTAAGGIGGALIGGVLGDVGGRYVGRMIAKALDDKTNKIGEFALSTPLLKRPEVEEIEDGIITREGKVIKPSENDTIYAMQDGGPLVNTLNKTPKMLGSLLKVEADSLQLMQEQNMLLREILQKTGSVILPGQNQSNNYKNFDQGGDEFRQLQMV